MDRSTFLYMDPTTPHDFAQCKTCWKFTGKSCLEFSSKDVVKPTGSCNLYVAGTPREERVGLESGGTTPAIAGYVDRKVRCEHCEFFEKSDNDCLFFRSLNIDYKVDKDGCCSNQTPIDKPSESKKETLKKYIR